MVESMSKGIGKRIRERRELLGYTREQFAEKLDISVKFAADIELGNKGMSLDTLIKICELFSISADYIIWGEKEKTDNIIGNLISELDNDEAEYAEELVKTFVKAISNVKMKNIK